MANEVLKKIQEAEKEADEIIFSANESAKRILKDIELKIKMITIILKILKKKKRNILPIIFIQIIQIEKKYLIG